MASGIRLVARFPAPILDRALLKGPGQNISRNRKNVDMRGITCVVWRHCSKVVMELSPPLTGGFQSVDFEQIVQQWQQHGIVVRKHKQVDCQEVGARL